LHPFTPILRYYEIKKPPTVEWWRLLWKRSAVLLGFVCDFLDPDVAEAYGIAVVLHGLHLWCVGARTEANLFLPAFIWLFSKHGGHCFPLRELMLEG
jgi:hypothetical protein